jgi:glucose/mannose-6-phosphate isomerase
VNIVFSGMGGSSLGAYVIRAMFSDTLPVPFDIVNDYRLPAYAGKKTIVILGSYSGTTEETLSGAQDARRRGCLLTGLASGGALADLFRAAKSPAYIFEPRHNPSNQPRLGTGYMLFGQMTLLSQMGFLMISRKELKELLQTLAAGNEQYGLSAPTAANRAKQLAIRWIEKIPVIVGGEFLSQVGRVIRNQLHESAKNYADYHVIPELNHHLMEGLQYPRKLKDIGVFLFLASPRYSERIQKRFSITADVVRKQGLAVEEFVPRSEGRIAQTFECIQFGAYVNYYMAILRGLDPSRIPWVDYFKAQLAG